MIEKIKSNINNVEIGNIKDSSLSRILESDYSTSKKIVIVDENTINYCLPILIDSIPFLENAEIIKLPIGEENKVLEICQNIWELFDEFQVQRNDLIINLGGGVVTDMGGFIVSVYKRGINFINIPTTLLAMVDASVGGKTGVNQGSHKNQLGVFSLPQLTICDAQFLKTLPEIEILSGKAEMIKHGLISSKELFYDILKEELPIPSNKLIQDAIQVKTNIVDNDFKETGNRKKLNFGHTVGHAIEGFLLENNKSVQHGICIAWGMLVEAKLSTKFSSLSVEQFQEIEAVISTQFPKLPIEKKDYNDIIGLMLHDKKNKGDKINFTLLSEIGNSQVDFELDREEVKKGGEVLGD